MLARSITRFDEIVTPLPEGALMSKGATERAKGGRAGRKLAPAEGEVWGDTSTLAAARSMLGELFPDAFRCGEQVTKITMDVSGESSFVAYIQSDTRYSNARKGYHRSNHAYFQVTPASVTMRCHDKDCHLGVTTRFPEDSVWRDQIFTGYDVIPVEQLAMTSTNIPTSWRELKNMPLPRKKFLLRVIRNSAARVDKGVLNKTNPFFLHRLDKLFETLQI